MADSYRLKLEVGMRVMIHMIGTERPVMGEILQLDGDAVWLARGKDNLVSVPATAIAYVELGSAVTSNVETMIAQSRAARDDPAA